MTTSETPLPRLPLVRIAVELVSSSTKVECAAVERSASTRSGGIADGLSPGPPQLTTSRWAPSLISIARVEAQPWPTLVEGGGAASITTTVPSALIR